MRIKALLTTLLLGTTLAGVASASPIVRDHRRPAYGYQVNYRGNVVAYDQGQDPYVEGIARGEWHSVVDSARIRRNGMVRIGLDAQPLRSLELQSLAGNASVRQISIQYTDGRIVPLEMSRDLDVHSPNLRLDLGAEGLRGVNAIVVYGSGRGAFRVLGA
jgi:hypothetical protein